MKLLNKENKHKTHCISIVLYVLPIINIKSMF